MKVHTSRIFLIVLISIFLIQQVQAMESIPLNGIFETAITNEKQYLNKFRDVTLEAVFTDPTGKKTEFWGFFDGNGSDVAERLDVKNSWTPNSGGEIDGTVWKLRFMPTIAGNWTFTWAFSDESKKGNGSFTVSAQQMRPGVLKVDEKYPRWVRNSQGYFYPTTIEMHYGEQLAYDIKDYHQNYDVYKKLGFNMVSFLALPTWDFTTWQVNPINNSGKSDPFITIWYQNKAHKPKDPTVYDSDRMLLFTWKRFEQHIEYLSAQDMYLFLFQGFNIKHKDKGAAVFPHEFSGEKFDWYMKYCMARLAPYYNLIWNNTWESDNGIKPWLAGLKKYDPWKHLRLRVESASSDLDVADIDDAPEKVPTTSNKPMWVVENNQETGLWGQEGEAGGTETMDQNKVLDLTWRHIMRSIPVFILEFKYKGYTDPKNHITFPWDRYGKTDGVKWFGIAHRFVRENVNYWQMTNKNDLAVSPNTQCLANLAGSEYLCYRKQGGDIQFKASEASYQVTWLDVKSGNTKALKAEHQGGTLTIKSPDNMFQAVHVKNQTSTNVKPSDMGKLNLKIESDLEIQVNGRLITNQ